MSRPPYFSALAIWPAFGHWTGGGYFRDASTILLGEDNSGLGPIETTLIPSSVRVIPVMEGEFRNKAVVPCGIRPASHTSDTFDGIAQSLQDSGVTFVDWLHPVSNNELAFACDGRIYRLERWQDVRVGEHLHSATLITDLRPLTFQLMRAPTEAMRW